MTGMEALREAVLADAARFCQLLKSEGLEIIDSGMVSSHSESAAAGKRFRDAVLLSLGVYE